MKQFLKRTIFVATVLLLVSQGLPAQSPHSNYSTAPVRNMGPMPADRDPIPNTAGTVRRFDSGLSMTIVTPVPVDAATQEAAYTVWWVVFNRPENCTNPVSDSNGVISACSAGDLTNPAVQAAGSGPQGYSWRRPLWRMASQGRAERQRAARVGADGVPLPASSLPRDSVNVKGAEVHLVVRNHGALDRDGRLPGVQHRADGEAIRDDEPGSEHSVRGVPALKLASVRIP
jgi:hypothetical protein